MVEMLIVECFQSSVRSEIILCIKSQDDFSKRNALTYIMTIDEKIKKEFFLSVLCG